MAPAGGSRADHSMTCEIQNSLRTSKTTKSISNTARADCHSNFSPTSVSHRWYISCSEGEREPVGKERKLVMIDEGVHAFLRDIELQHRAAAGRNGTAYMAPEQAKGKTVDPTCR